MGRVEREIYIIHNYDWDYGCGYDLRSTYDGVLTYFIYECDWDQFSEEITMDMEFEDLKDVVGDAGYSIHKQYVTFYED